MFMDICRDTKSRIETNRRWHYDSVGYCMLRTDAYDSLWPCHGSWCMDGGWLEESTGPAPPRLRAVSRSISLQILPHDFASAAWYIVPSPTVYKFSRSQHWKTEGYIIYTESTPLITAIKVYCAGIVLLLCQTLQVVFDSLCPSSFLWGKKKKNLVRESNPRMLTRHYLVIC